MEDVTVDVQVEEPNDEKHNESIRGDPDSFQSLKDGRRAWFVCASSFTIQVLHVGFLHAFGVFFVAFSREFQTSKAAVAWVGSACYGFLMLLAPLVSVLIKKFGKQPVAASGSLVCALALVLSSYTTNLNQMYGTFTFLYAAGCTMNYTPCMTIATDYFEKYVALATGIMMSGTSVGTLLLSPISQVLVDAIGWRNTFRCFAGTCAIGFICGLQLRPLPNMDGRDVEPVVKVPLARRIMKELQLWKNKVYCIWLLALFFVMFGFFVPYVYLISLAGEFGISTTVGSILMLILGACTAIGRVAFGKIIDKGYLDRLRMDQLSLVVSGTFMMLLPLTKSIYGLLAYVIVAGLLDGCYVVLLPTLTEAFAGGDRKVMAWGFLTGICSVSFTLGPPVAGWIYDATGSYNASFHVAGIPVIVGALIMFFIPWAQKTARSTNAMVTDEFYDVMDNINQEAEDQILTMSSAIAIPRISSSIPEKGSVDHRTEVMSLQTRGSFVIVDLSSHLVQAFSTSHNKHIPITDDDKLPQALNKAMNVLHKKSASILSFSNKDGHPSSFKTVSLDRVNRDVDAKSFFNRYNSNPCNVCRSLQPGSSQPQDITFSINNTAMAGGHNRHGYSEDQISSLPNNQILSAATPPILSDNPQQEVIESPVGSPPQEIYPSIFQSITSNPTLPPIQEFVGTNAGSSNRAVTSSSERQGSSPNESHNEYTDGENHAIFEMSNLTDFSGSNQEVTEEGGDN